MDFAMCAFFKFRQALALLRAGSRLAGPVASIALVMLAMSALAVPPAHSAPVDRNVQRAQENDAAVMIVAGRPDTSMMKIADDLSIALDDPDGNFRVVPVAGDGAAGNVRDIILLRNIDLAITDFTILNHMRQSRDLSQMLSREIAHVMTLFPEKLSILARTDIQSIEDLTGKRVSVGLRDSSSSVHAEKIFSALGVEPETVHLAEPDSALALDNGEIDAFMCFCLSSPGVYKQVMFNPDLRILPIPYAPGLQADYLPDTLVHTDFPSFITKDQTVDTLAVTLTLVTYNWEKGNPRYSRVAKFVERFFNNLPKLQQAPRHKGWQSVMISASAPDWPRFAAVDEWRTAQNADALQEMRVAFGEFLNRWETASAPVAETGQTQLFEEFLTWRANAQ
jgi:TRAP-type uncharacterized transport system substrate-binding protein